MIVTLIMKVLLAFTGCTFTVYEAFKASAGFDANLSSREAEESLDGNAIEKKRSNASWPSSCDSSSPEASKGSNSCNSGDDVVCYQGTCRWCGSGARWNEPCCECGSACGSDGFEFACATTTTTTQAVCVCSHGTGAVGASCPLNGASKCASCDHGYRLLSSRFARSDWCSAVPCPMNSVGPAPSCTCQAGYTGTIVAATNGYIGSCTAVPCPANAEGSPPSCTCSPGFTGTITPKVGGYDGSCAIVPCPTNSEGTAPACACKAGYTGRITAAVGGYVGACNAVPCPENAEGHAPSCACKAGYTGTIVPATGGYSGECTAVECPANSEGDAPSCTCMAGYTGRITPKVGGYDGSCTAVPCPTNSEGTAPNCVCKAGYTGTITPVIGSYTGTCTAVPCPTNSGGTAPSCTCNAGYTGTITPVQAGYSTSSICCPTTCGELALGACPATAACCTLGPAGTNVSDACQDQPTCKPFCYSGYQSKTDQKICSWKLCSGCNASKVYWTNYNTPTQTLDCLGVNAA